MTETIHTAQFRQCRLSYKLTGMGEPVVFIQGVGLHGDGWGPQTNELSARFLCLSFDNRGMALSGMALSQPGAVPITVEQMASDTLAVMDAAGIAAAHIVGHSLGGCVAQQIALSNPERVKSLALLCTSGRGADATRITLQMAWLGARTRIGTRRMRRLAFLRLFLSAEYLGTHNQDEVAENLAPIFGHDPGETPPIVMRQHGALKGFNAVGRLHELSTIPTLIVSASGDIIFPPECGRALASKILGSRFVEVSGACHGVVIEQAAAINGILTEHIDQAIMRDYRV